jgi:hypothetical protein
MAKNELTLKDLIETVDGVSEKQMLGRFEEFLKQVEANDFEIVPSISAFADFLSFSRADVRRWFGEHPTASTQMRDMCADTIASGAMLKKYDARVTSFALKNWCGWRETPKELAKDSKEIANEEKAKALLAEYTARDRRKKYRVV